MIRILAPFKKYRLQLAGATGVEYALMAAGISLSIIFAVFFFGDTLQLTFSNMFTTMTAFMQEG